MDREQLMLLETTPITGIRPVLAGAGKISDLFVQLKSLFSEGEAYQLFAQPMEGPGGPNGPQIRWYSPLAGEIRRFGDLDQEQQGTLLDALRDQMARLYLLIDTNLRLAADERVAAVTALEQALEVPSLDEIGRAHV